MERILEALEHLRGEIDLLRRENANVHGTRDELTTLRAENAELREELLELVTDYASLLDRDYGTRREPEPSRDNPAIRRARATLARHKERAQEKD